MGVIVLAVIMPLAATAGTWRQERTYTLETAHRELSTSKVIYSGQIAELSH